MKQQFLRSDAKDQISKIPALVEIYRSQSSTVKSPVLESKRPPVKRPSMSAPAVPVKIHKPSPYSPRHATEPKTVIIGSKTGKRKPKSLSESQVEFKKPRRVPRSGQSQVKQSPPEQVVGNRFEKLDVTDVCEVCKREFIDVCMVCF